MIHDDVAEFALETLPGTALAGLDFGEKTIGVAVSDTRRQVATPLETIRRKKFTQDAEALAAIVAARGIGGAPLPELPLPALPRAEAHFIEARREHRGAVHADVGLVLDGDLEG